MFVRGTDKLKVNLSMEYQRIFPAVLKYRIYTSQWNTGIEMKCAVLELNFWLIINISLIRL